MFSSTKINNSPCTNNTSLYNNINETANGISRNFSQPKITSTPLMKRESIFATPPKHVILSPRRYSLSEIATPPRSNRRDLTKVITTGPLLASTKYNVNVSTYEDTKSPGLASRIVQYNDEAEREKAQSRPPTHQAKYGSPGLFPVVHLFKKNLPTLDQKPKRVTVRIASPEYSKYHSQEYNRKLLEGIIRPSSPMNSGSPFSPNSHPNSSTRSVLDALKEISRKRIHANEDYDLNEDSGKRLRITNNEDSNKRLREDSSSEKSPSPGKPTSKRICMYDEYAASCSSTNFSFNKTEQQPKRKSISISTLTENEKEPKQVKLINAETQTIINETVEDTKSSENSKEEEQNKNDISDESATQKKSPLKIFDDAPLERIRKNRLAALMGSLTGKEPVLLPKPDYASVLNAQTESSDTPDSAAEVPKPSEKPLVSILSSPKKPSPTKSNKHVHFSVPESTSQTNFGSAAVQSFPSAPSSVVVSAPVSSASETNPTFAASNKISRETPAPPSSPVGLQPTSSDSSSVLPAISFGSASNSSSVTSIVSKESSSSILAADSSKTGFTIPNFQFKPPVTSASLIATSNVTPATQLKFSPPTPSTVNVSVANSPPKMGGFKFDLSKPVTTTAAPVSASPTFSFGSPNKSSDFGAVKALPAPQSATPGTFSFGAKAPAASTTSFSSGFSFVGATTASPAIAAPTVTTSAAPTFKFGSASVENPPTTSAGFPPSQSSTVSFGITNITTPSLTLPTNTSTSQVSSVVTSSGPAFGASKTPFFSFGASKTTSASPGFGVPASTASSATFGAPSTTSSSFGTPTSNFLNTSSALPTSGFGMATTTSSTLSGGFGAPPTTSNAGFGSNPPPMFGGNKTVSPFGVSTTAAPGFGAVSTTNSPPFGKTNAAQFGQNTTQSAFGAPSTTTASFATSNAFGATTTTASSSVFGSSNNSSVFGAKSGGGFGAPSGNTNIFGGAVNTQPSGFGTSTSTNPMFGLPTTSPFGGTTKTTTAPSFGSANTPSFNFAAKTTASSSFGSGNSFGTTTTASTGFGSVTTPSFGTASNSFGGSTNFGPSNNAFGVVTTSNQPSGFGTTTTPSFGTANSGFNAVDKSSVFGNAPSAAPAFGSNAASPFGNSTSTPSFGTPNNTPGFGANSAITSFSKPQPNQNAFGAPTTNAFATNSFGATQQQAPNFGSTNPPSTQSAVFSFGATPTPKPPGVFSFGAGAASEVPKPSFNFTGGSTQPPAFGSGGAPSFGSGGPAPFGAAAIPQFNAPQLSSQGMFSIGSGSSTGKSRTHLKVKRRT